MSIQSYLDDLFYPDVTNNWDDKLFRQKILNVIRPEHHVLDMGAGAGIVDDMNFIGRASSVTGIDLDERVTNNPFLSSMTNRSLRIDARIFYFNAIKL